MSVRFRRTQKEEDRIGFWSTSSDSYRGRVFQIQVQEYKSRLQAGYDSELQGKVSKRKRRTRNIGY
jgi:hypothetical protein